MIVCCGQSKRRCFLIDTIAHRLIRPSCLDCFHASVQVHHAWFKLCRPNDRQKLHAECKRRNAFQVPRSMPSSIPAKGRGGSKPVPSRHSSSFGERRRLRFWGMMLMMSNQQQRHPASSGMLSKLQQNQWHTGVDIDECTCTERSGIEAVGAHIKPPSPSPVQRLTCFLWRK